MCYQLYRKNSHIRICTCIIHCIFYFDFDPFITIFFKKSVLISEPHHNLVHIHIPCTRSVTFEHSLYTFLALYMDKLFTVYQLFATLMARILEWLELITQRVKNTKVERLQETRMFRGMPGR